MTKRLSPAEMPHWPRRLSAKLAAAYVGVSTTKFLQGVKAGRYPPGKDDGGNRLWDRTALDTWVDEWARGTPASRAPADRGGDPVMEAIERGDDAAPAHKRRAA